MTTICTYVMFLFTHSLFLPTVFLIKKKNKNIVHFLIINNHEKRRFCLWQWKREHGTTSTQSNTNKVVVTLVLSFIHSCVWLCLWLYLVCSVNLHVSMWHIDSIRNHISKYEVFVSASNVMVPLPKSQLQLSRHFITLVCCLFDDQLWDSILQKPRYDTTLT